jgi:hypothetical protein
VDRSVRRITLDRPEVAGVDTSVPSHHISDKLPCPYRIGTLVPAS